MKKNYLFLAAATTLFATCVQTDVVNDIPEPQQQAISFDAFANKTTRTEITDVDDLKKNDGGFHVWGYKSTDTWSTSYTVFDNVPVSWNTTLSTPAWYYENTQYWDQNAIYKFFAVAPQEGNATYGIDDGSTNVSNKYMITITNASNSTDYLIDRDGVTNTVKDNDKNIFTGVKGFENGTVNFNFNHIMSKISFKLKAGVEEDIVVTSLTMTGWDNGEGTFDQSPDFDASTRSNDEWKITTPGNDGSFEIINSSTHASGLTLPKAKTVIPVLADENDLTSYISLITIPQNINASTLTFTISYKIVRGEDDNNVEDSKKDNDLDDEVFTNQVGILSSAQSWYTDTHTTYTIIVTPDAIEFGDPTIDEWSEIEDRGNEPEDEDNKNEDNLPL